jgi:phosphate transporter
MIGRAQSLAGQSFLPSVGTPLAGEEPLLPSDSAVPKPAANSTHRYHPLIATVIFIGIYISPVLADHPTAHSCLAILCTVSFLWITEAIPPFATAYLIPILSVWLRIGIDPSTGERIPAPEMARLFSFRFMDPIIFVFLGSITLSAALQKLNVTTRVSRAVLGLVSPRPSTVLLVLMLINVTIGAFLSNVASTTLTLSLALPIIRSLNPRDPFIKAILFGIAWSGNCGGMPTTIASPQNVIATKVVADSDSPVSFLSWLVFGVPVSLVLCVGQWFYLTRRFVSGNERFIAPSAACEEPWSSVHTEAVLCTVVTICLWTLGDSLAWFMGHIGIASLVPIVWLFGRQILTVTDFNTFKWSTLSLLGGGLVLGEAMRVSGLLDQIAVNGTKALGDVSAWVMLLILLVVEGLLASLLSSTTAASIIFPLIMAIGNGTGHAPLLVVLSALMISTAQLFHISSFPNALVSSVCPEVTDDTNTSGTPFLTGRDYIVYGAPTIVFGIAIISTLGYVLTVVLGL